MIFQPGKKVQSENTSITVVVLAMVMLVLFSACSGGNKEVGEAITERDSLPVMDTRGVTTLISDSGVIRYRINAEEREAGADAEDMEHGQERMPHTRLLEEHELSQAYAGKSFAG